MTRIEKRTATGRELYDHCTRLQLREARIRELEEQRERPGAWKVTNLYVWWAKAIALLVLHVVCKTTT